MKKITEIYIEREYMKSERDAYGNRIKVPTTGSFKREPVLANAGLRFGHYLIDSVIIFGLTYLLAIVIAIISYDLLLAVATPFFSLRTSFYTFSYDLFSLAIYVGYFFITETTMQRSIGKFATGTVVIDEYGNKPSAGVIIARSCCRLIPFDGLSCIGGRGWHDKITGTFVVKQKEAEELRRLLENPDSYKLSDSEEILD